MNLSLTSELEADKLLEHIESPYHRGRIQHPTCEGGMRNAACGDQVNLQLLIENGNVLQAWFEGQGCVISQASASILCEHVEKMAVSTAVHIRPHQIVDLLGAPISPSRQHCVLVGYFALQKILNSDGSKLWGDGA